MRIKTMLTAASILVFPLVAAMSTTISLPGDYERSPADIMILDDNVPMRSIVYNLENLLGNDIVFAVRFGNLNAMNEDFGDIPTAGSFGVFNHDELLISQDGILDCVFGGIEIPAGELVDEDGRLRLDLRLLDDSDPLAFYRPWLYVTDDVAPAATEDLEVVRTFPTSLKLQWTAVGDDGLEGTAAMYEIRYSKWPVDEIEEWWGYAEQARDVPYPDEPGSEESFWVTDLDTVSTYYIVLVTYDELGNPSDFSNVASGTTGEDSGPEPGENYCLEFNGENNRATVPFNEILNPREQITIEAWVYPYVLIGASQRMVLDKPFYSWSHPYYQYNMGVNDEGTLFATVTTDGIRHTIEQGEYRVPLEEWTHLAWTYDGSEFKTYINGQLNQSSLISGLIDAFETDLTIGVRGALNWQYGFFDGLIDEIRIWDTARTEEEIQFYKNLPLSGDEPGLIAYWNFDEGAGQMFYDVTENGSSGYLGFGPQNEEFDPTWVESDAPIEYRRVDNYENGTPSVPTTFLLSQNYPNPFNAETQISFSLPTPSAVRIDIYDMLGRRVNTLINAHMDAGVHHVVWNGKSESGEALSSGIYIYRMSAGQYSDSKKMLMVK